MTELRTRHARLVACGSALLALAAFLLLRPYEGIVHDARLYVGYALAPLDSDGIGRDIMFTLDGQASKTLYPALLRALAKALGLTSALAALTYGALVLWFVSAWRLVRAIVPHTVPSAGIAACLVLLGSLHTYYGGASTIRFAEPFAAPRTLAEAFGMLAIVQAMRKHWWSTASLLIAAAVVHPIMTAPVVAVIVVMLAPNDRVRGTLFAGGSALGVTLAAAAVLVTSDGGLLGRFDAEWMEVLERYQSLVLLRYWTGMDLARVVLQLVTLGVACYCAPGSSRPFFEAVVLVCAGGLVVSAIGVDLLSHQLMGQAQPWRALWLAGVCSGIALAIIVRSASAPTLGEQAQDQQIIRQRMSALLLVGAWMLLAFTPAVALLGVMAWWLWAWPQSQISEVAGAPSLRFPAVAPLTLGAALGVCVVGYLTLQSVITWRVLGAAPPGAVPSVWLIWYRTGVPAAVLSVVALWILARLPREWDRRTPASEGPPLRMWMRRALPGVAAIVVGGVVILQDQRTAYARALEGGLAMRFLQNDDSARGQFNGSVAWPGAELEGWAFLGRPSWGTVNQGVPKVFSRKLALQWAPRFDALLDTSAVITVGAAQARPQKRDLELSELRRICSMTDAPSAVVVPLPTSLMLAGEAMALPSPRFDPPASLTDVWRTIDSVRVVPCAGGSG